VVVAIGDPLDGALKIAHRGYVMENGAITLEDRAENLLRNEGVKKAYLGI